METKPTSKNRRKRWSHGLRALDVCWEEKKFRVISSHLTPFSAMLLYVKDVDDFRSLVTARGRDSHVHICVGAQAGLGTMPPRPYGANIGTATTVSHRVEKQRMFESFIMEILLTATLRMTVPSTSTPATTTGITNHNRLTTSFPLTNSLRSRTFDPGTDGFYQIQACEDTTEKDCLETDLVGMPRSHRLQQ